MIYPLLFAGFGPQEIIVIVLIVVLLFGAKKIPELMRGMGRGVKEFKDAVNGDGIVGDKDEEKNEEKIGSRLTVLCDGYDEENDVYYGRSYADAPDVDGKVYFKSNDDIAVGDFVQIEVTEALDYDLVGEIV